MNRAFLTLVVLLYSLSAFSQQLTIPRPSPLCKVDQEFATSRIMLEYSRPSVKGRTIFGDLVPWGELWRTGANASTKIYFGEDVQVNGYDVPKGKYALFTIPEKTEWTVILSRDTTLSGTDGYKQENDWIRFKVKPTTTGHFVETMTIDVNHILPNNCQINLSWEKTSIGFSVKADIDSKIMKQIDEAMKGDKPPYWQAANYYFENGKDINQAYAWVNKAIEARPEAYWMMTTKAKMELQMGKYKEAMATAEQAKALAVKENDNSYVQQNDKTIASAKAKL